MSKIVYKNLKDKQANQLKWQRENSEHLSNYRKDYKLKNPEKVRDWNNKGEQKHLIKRRKQTKELLGTFCKICGNSKRRIHYHEIHGIKHTYDYHYILTHLEDFIPLCCRCHNVLHYLFNLPEEQQKELLKLNNSLKAYMELRDKV